MGSGSGVPSIETATALALGARRRKTTRLSGRTSGETTGAGGAGGAFSCAEMARAAKKVANSRKLRFIGSPFSLDGFRGREIVQQLPRQARENKAWRACGSLR